MPTGVAHDPRDSVFEVRPFERSCLNLQVYDGSVMADPLPPNPFRPGAGRQPAHMGHRPEIEQAAAEHPRGSPGWRAGCSSGLPVRAARQRQDRPARLARRAGASGVRGASHCTCPAASRTSGVARAAMSTRRRLPAQNTPAPGTSSRSMWKLEFRDCSEQRSGRSAATIRGPGLTDWLEQDRHPVLFAVDEAQEADPEVLGRFLNAVQLAGRHRPVAAVLAGTPGLQDTLHDSRASFWNRGLRLPDGLLPDAEAQAVLARPFLDAKASRIR